ncbi:hypothetical protein B0H12DRAFT_233568 [Mycena haematopus]|nr:hypothetical protein B0H12DRAFT_233568 [Mycena haematopus]
MFAKPTLCIQNSHLILRFYVACEGLSGLANIKPSHHHILRPNRPLRRHLCIPTMMHSLFSPRNEAKTNLRSWTPPDCFSDGETEDEMDVEAFLLSDDYENMPPSPTPANARAGPSGQASASSSFSLLVQAASSAPQVDTSCRLWASDWVPVSGRYTAIHQADDFAKAIFDTANRTSHSNLAVSGRDIAGLAHSLIGAIKSAVAIHDFTTILSPGRTFNIIREEENFFSTGEGVEREVIYSAFCEFTSQSGTWLLPRFDWRYSIATAMPPASSSLVNASRRDSLTTLGCLTALMLIHGLAPDPLSPALVQYAANKCDLESLSRDFVGEWHPELRALIDKWIEIGPTGDLAPFQPHFASYHDMQVSTLESRDLRQHEALASEMLRTALISPHPPSHTELEAFFIGFKMPCRNGFNFTEVLRSTPGGSASFITRIWASVIHDFDSLQPSLTVRCPNRPTLEQMTGADTSHLIFSMNLCDILYDFLKGTGIPCPGLFREARPRLSSSIPFDDVDSPAFRSRALCWAATGSPHVELDDSRGVHVHWVDDQDQVYHADAVARAALMKWGTISFRSCYRTARLPVLHLIELCSRSYPAHDVAGNPTEPHTLQQAIESWLLIEILAGISNHTIL